MDNKKIKVLIGDDSAEYMASPVPMNCGRSVFTS